MKNLKFNLTITLMLCLALFFFSCNNSSVDSKKDEVKTEMVTEAFEIELLGNYVYVGPDTISTPKCADSLYIWRAIVDCDGSSKKLGDITAHFDFCGDAEGYYGNCYGYLVDGSKDTLFYTVEGQVIQGKTDEHPDFVVSYWKDEFVLLGGTGKYEGATGSGVTNDYNSAEDPNSHHHWIGSITMKM